MRKPNEKERELFIRYGSAASEAMFDYPCDFFELPDCVGFIAYRPEHHCAIVFGDPICPKEELSNLTQAFQKHCLESDLNIIYITVSEAFTKEFEQDYPISIEVCEELLFDPQVNPVFESHRLQHRVEKALKHGLTFHEYLSHNPKIEQELMAIGEKWSHARKGLSLHLGHLDFFETTLGKRWFYVKEGDRITAMAMLSRLEAREGWLLKFFMTLPEVVHETSEFLMVSLLTTLKEEGCHFLTKGMAPMDDLGEVRGLGPFSKLARGVFHTISFFFKFKKRKEYWKRYHPCTVPSYVLLANSKIGLNEIRALIKVFRVSY
jgi:lysylphosphatidylglycerol synthetase-like protein (DUF2156 family)